MRLDGRRERVQVRGAPRAVEPLVEDVERPRRTVRVQVDLHRGRPRVRRRRAGAAVAAGGHVVDQRQRGRVALEREHARVGREKVRVRRELPVAREALEERPRAPHVPREQLRGEHGGAQERVPLGAALDGRPEVQRRPRAAALGERLKRHGVAPHARAPELPVRAHHTIEVAALQQLLQLPLAALAAALAAAVPRVRRRAQDGASRRAALAPPSRQSSAPATAAPTRRRRERSSGARGRLAPMGCRSAPRGLRARHRQRRRRASPAWLSGRRGGIAGWAVSAGPASPASRSGPSPIVVRPPP